MPGVILRTAIIADCDRLAEVHVAASHETYSDILPPAAFANLTIAKRTAQWREVLAAADHPVFVAEQGGHIVGLADGGPAREGEALGQEMQLYAIYLLNAVKRQGIGTRLLQCVMRQFLEGGATTACVWTLRDALPARRFYEHHGAQFAAEKLEHHRAGYDRVIVGYVWPDLRRKFALP